MRKYKICPSCGAKNSPTLIECDQCEADLVGVPVTAEPQEEKKETSSRFVRICDCGVYNQPQARRCTVCGEDISDIPAVKSKSELNEAEEKARIVSLDGSYTYELCENDLVLGRNRDMADYLNRFSYVSRIQAKLSWNEKGLFLINLSRSNPTCVNNYPLACDQSIQLHDGDEIGLGGCIIDGKRQEQAAYLIVHLPARKE